MRLAALAALVATAAAADWPTEKSVVVLDDSNFDDFVSAQEYTIVEFYAPWCGHCKSLEPEWAAAAAKTSKLKPKVYLAKVDADQHKDLAGKYDVSGYPTIKIFKNGKIDGDYDGPREAKGIVKFVKSAVGITGGAGSVQRISTKAELDEMAKATATLVGLFKEPVSASAMFKAFAEVASELPSMVDEKNPVKVVYSASYKEVPLAADLGVKSPPAILLLKPGQEPVAMTIPRNRKEFTEDSLTDWVTGEFDKK